MIAAALLMLTQAAPSSERPSVVVEEGPDIVFNCGDPTNNRAEIEICEAEERDMNWPELPQSGFIVGRVATTVDVDTGRAVFSMDGKSAGPIDIEIPQYAMWQDESGADHPVIVTQAERAPNGMQIVGLTTFDGQHMAVTLPEVRLLGIQKPN